MTFLSDIEAGREKYRRRNERRNAPYNRRIAKVSHNFILVELGSFMEFISSIFRKKSAGLQKPSSEGPSTPANPYANIVRGDINSFFSWVCSYLPKEKKVYDPLDAAWRRGRRG